RFGIGAGTVIADVGAGTGRLAIPLAALGAAVIAVDPNEAMLAEGRLEAARRGVTGIPWVQGTAERLREHVNEPIDLATFGASLHWIDAPRALAECDALVRPAGGVAVVSRGAS